VLIGNLTILIIARLDPPRSRASQSAFYMGAMREGTRLAAIRRSAIVFDFLQWAIHNLLHRVSWLWSSTQIHHSIVDMDWIGDLAFHWVEVVVYRSLLTFYAAFFGFQAAVMFLGRDREYRHRPLRPRESESTRRRTKVRDQQSGNAHLAPNNHPDSGPINRNFGITLSIWTGYSEPLTYHRAPTARLRGHPKLVPGPNSQAVARAFVALFKALIDDRVLCH